MFLKPLAVFARLYTERGTEELFHGLAYDKVITAPVVGRFLARTGRRSRRARTTSLARHRLVKSPIRRTCTTPSQGQ
jgi:hypothetical protein